LLDVSEDSVKLSVDDNGKGFDVESYSEDSSLNLRIIKDRVEMLGGKLLLDSTLGKGTKISLSVPVQ